MGAVGSVGRQGRLLGGERDEAGAGRDPDEFQGVIALLPGPRAPSSLGGELLTLAGSNQNRQPRLCSPLTPRKALPGASQERARPELF